MRQHAGDISQGLARILHLFILNPNVIFILPRPSFSPPLYSYQVGQLMWDNKTSPPFLHGSPCGTGSQLRTQHQEFRKHLISFSNLNSLCCAICFKEDHLNMFNNAPFCSVSIILKESVLK